ncbi:hypothetical protein HNY73_009694 [Argiope bruennichi]|uniref:C2H2-type domain-containing protein n=1 Tax=Argiope bruennichi TaxID=94029 RepID=A0A8T0FH17_ARGBR|nr:hypothetical protein HNY73_009694 [Argiope bruennichi]
MQTTGACFERSASMSVEVNAIVQFNLDFFSSHRALELLNKTPHHWHWLWNPHNILHFNPISDVQGIEAETNVNSSSEKVKSDYRPENHKHEFYEKEIFVTGESGVDIQKQSIRFCRPDPATTDEEKRVINKTISDCKNISGIANLIADPLNPDLPSRSKEPENDKRQVPEVYVLRLIIMDQYHCRRCGNILTRDEDHPCFFHKKFDYMYFLQRPVESDKNSDEENVIRNALSDNNNVSGTANSTVNPDLQQGTNEPKNDQTQVSEGVNDEHISPEGLSESHCKKDKMLIDVKKPTSSKEEDNAVAGPSGMCSRQKKFPCSLCPKEFKKEAYLVKHYRMHTGETPHVQTDQPILNLK